jgi:hypothetical protein
MKSVLLLIFLSLVAAAGFQTPTTQKYIKEGLEIDNIRK